MSPLPVVVAAEDETGRMIFPDACMNFSEHTSETAAQASAATCPAAHSILKYTTGTNRQRFIVLVPVMPVDAIRAMRKPRRMP